MTSKALVLGGGGPVGIAWQSGLLAGLARAGVDLGQADHILGTSAGSFVGFRMAMGAPTATLADALFADAVSPVRPVARGGRPPADLSRLMRLMSKAQAAHHDDVEVRAEIGAYALACETMDEDEYIASFGRGFVSLPQDAWPQRSFACTAVDAETGAFQLWTGESGVGVARAVASSCSMPSVYPPVTVSGRRYVDGGARSHTNADMATGHDLVVVVAINLDAWTPGGALAKLFTRLEKETQSLRDGGATVVTIEPDDGSRAAMAGNLMDFRKRPDAARAGMAQGEALADSLRVQWAS
jgi:NTE family protein